VIAVRSRLVATLYKWLRSKRKKRKRKGKKKGEKKRGGPISILIRAGHSFCSAVCAIEPFLKKGGGGKERKEEKAKKERGGKANSLRNLLCLNSVRGYLRQKKKKRRRDSSLSVLFARELSKKGKERKGRERGKGKKREKKRGI